MSIQIITKEATYVCTAMTTDTNSLICYDAITDTHKMYGIPGTHASKEAAMNRVFEDYDVLTRTLDIRGWDV